MKLLVCATEYYPQGAGIANVTHNIVERLKERGVECTVCSPTGPDIKLGSQALIQKTGIIGILNYWFQVSQSFEGSEYDAVWLQNPFIISGNPFKRCLVTMHSTYFGSSSNGVGNLPFHLYKMFVAQIERHCLSHMSSKTLFTGVGKPVCKELEMIGVESNRIIHIPNGVYTEQFRPRPDKRALRKKFRIPEDDIILLSVGRLTPAKQPLALIEVFSHLENEMGNVTLCIAGEGELHERMQEFIQRLGLRKVLLLGHVDHDLDLPELYACSDYYIMASKYEGMPLTLLEAMSSGLPCIVSDIPNLKIIEDSNCGLIVDFSDSTLASKVILNFIHLDRRDFEYNARNYSVDNLSWDKVADNYLKALHDVCTQ